MWEAFWLESIYIADFFPTSLSFNHFQHLCLNKLFSQFHFQNAATQQCSAVQCSAVQCTLEDDHCTAVQQRSAALKTSWWHSNHRSCIWWSSSNHQRSIHPHYCQMLSSDDGSPSKRQIQKFVNTNRDTVFVYKFSPLLKSDLWKIFAKSWQRRCHRVRLWSRYGKSPKC